MTRLKEVGGWQRSDTINHTDYVSYALDVGLIAAWIVGWIVDDSPTTFLPFLARSLLTLLVSLTMLSSARAITSASAKPFARVSYSRPLFPAHTTR